MRLGDLDALKEDLFIKFGNQLPNGLLEQIDNAPTVEERSYEQGVIDGRDTEFDNGFEQGYAKGYENCEHDNERPQGEWKLISMGLTNKYQCSLCGRTISPMYSPMLLSDYPFCHCGAKMKMKDGKEE